jgi:hypothetical protein
MKFRNVRIRTFFRTALVGTALAVVATSVAGAVAGDPAPKRYTGCLKTDGTIVKVKEGDSPLSSCATGQAKITIGNGDITGIVAGTGLTGGADQGTPTLALTGDYSLPQGCAVGSPAKRAASGWYCGTDNGTYTKSVGGLSVDVDEPPNEGNCVGDYSLMLPAYVPPGAPTAVYSASFSLPTGTYLTTPTASTRWFVSRTHDLLDGEQFSKGFVRMRLQRTRSGVTTTVTTWARSVSENSDGAGLPYFQDPGVLTALAGDTYRIVADADAVFCTRARLIEGGMDFTRIG